MSNFVIINMETTHTAKVMGSPKWIKGVSANPSGRPRGAISKRTQQWNALQECITGELAEEFMNGMRKLYQEDLVVGMRFYLEVLNYFKPKLSAVSNTMNVTDNKLMIQIPNEVPIFPANIEEDDSIPDEQG